MDSEENSGRKSEVNAKEENKKSDGGNLFECYICMDKPTNPVATTCGHIFCWKCLQTWISGKTSLVCPLCRNGLDINRVIPLYTGGLNTSDKDDRPKTERIAPVRQDSTFFNSVLRGVGFYGTTAETHQQILPSPDEVKVNQLATVFCLIGILIVMCILYF